MEVEPVDLPGWNEVADVRQRCAVAEVTPEQLESARATATRWRSTLEQLCSPGTLLGSIQVIGPPGAEHLLCDAIDRLLRQVRDGQPARTR